MSKITDRLDDEVFAENVTSDIQTQLNAKIGATVTNPVNGQVLTWNGTTWVNSATVSGVTDHTLLSNIGTNTHAQIDTALTRLANTSGTNTGDQDLSGYSLIAHNHAGVYEPADATILKSASIGVTVQAYNANTAVTNTAQIFSGAQRLSVDTISYTASWTPNLATNNLKVMTLTGNVVINNPINVAVGQSGTFTLIQDATGGRTVAWGTYFKWEGGIAPTYVTAANSVSTYAYHVESATQILVVPIIDWK